MAGTVTFMYVASTVRRATVTSKAAPLTTEWKRWTSGRCGCAAELSAAAQSQRSITCLGSV